MTIKLLEDHPNRIPTYQRLGRGWSMMGSVHHHCTASAFQSGTDSSDEKTKEGLHITIGNLDKPRFSIHSRTSFRQQMFPANLAEWFEIEETIAASTPPSTHAAILEWTLTTPPAAEDAAFPDWWKENVIKVVYATRSVNSVSWPPAAGQYPSSVGVVPGKGKRNVYGRYTQPQRDHWFVDDVNQVMEKYGNFGPTEVLEILASLDSDGTREIITALIEYELDAADALGILEVGWDKIEQEANVEAALEAAADDALPQLEDHVPGTGPINDSDWSWEGSDHFDQRTVANMHRDYRRSE